MFDSKEIENMKSKIDLRAYAASQGYALDKRESWRGSAVDASPERRQDYHQAQWSGRSLRVLLGPRRGR